MSARTVFDTFAWPQSPTRGRIAEVAATAVAQRVLRREVMAAHRWSLRALYRTLDETGDNPLRTAYTMPAKSDPLESSTRICALGAIFFFHPVASPRFAYQEPIWLEPKTNIPMSTPKPAN